ncbi:MAG: VWA domain-containing protein [Sedimentisphaerales bacterium]
MIFADYPGHLIAALFLLISAGLTLFTFHSGELRKAKLQAYRLPLILLQYLSIAIMLFILWNPSRSEETRTSVKNSVLVLFDTSESMSVIEDGQANRLDKALDRFEKTFHPFALQSPDYKIYGFDHQTYHSGSSDFLRRWGSQSNLQSIFSMLSQYDVVDEAGRSNRARESQQVVSDNEPIRTRNVVGAVVFTDGQADNRNVDAYLSLHNSNFQVLFVGVGSREHKPDVAVESLEAPSRMVIDSVCKAKVVIVTRNLTDQPVTVELLKDDYIVDSREIPTEVFEQSRKGGNLKVEGIGDGLAYATVEFAIGADTLGNHTLSARAKIAEPEVNPANNVRTTMIEVVEENRLRVLFYSQVASFDVGKIRQALVRDAKIDLDLALDAIRTPILGRGGPAWPPWAGTWACPPDDRQGFNQYDVVILGPCDLDALTNTQIDSLYSFVVDRGGGLILLPGRGEYGPAGWNNKKVKTLIPMILDSNESTVFASDPGQIEPTLEATYGRPRVAALGRPIGLPLFDGDALKDFREPVLPYYRVIDRKPASTTLATIKETPIIAVHRVGRGKVCLINVSKLFLLYREDLQGGLLYEIMAGLTAQLGKITHREAGIELFAERVTGQADKVKFEAYVCDQSFEPVAGANVLLSFADRVLSMSQIERGRYAVEIENVRDQAMVATAQAELNGTFLGERTIAVNLPPAKTEMSNVEMDEEFLQSLAKKLNGKYCHVDEIDDNVAKTFEAQTQIGSTRRMTSIWPTWPLLLILCGLLSASWFLRRAVGLV